ncbi:MAG: YdjY domain-containing protein [Pseudomonadota bacterium]
MIFRCFFRLLFCCFWLFFALGQISFAQDHATSFFTAEKPADPAQDMIAPQIRQLDDDSFKIGEVFLNKKDRFIRINGKINMSDGLIEYLGCTPEGKVHESVLVLDAQPYHIQVALLLLGLVPGDQPIEFQGAPQTPCGSPVQLLISWQSNGKTIEVLPEQLVMNIESKHPMAKTNWIFTGSITENQTFMAQKEGSIIAVYHDPVALIDHIGQDGTNDVMMHANKQLLPPVGTPVILKIFPHPDPAVKQLTQCQKPKQR